MKEIKKFRTDNGLEFYNNEFNDLCFEYGILRHRIVGYILQQNKVKDMHCLL